MAATDTDFVAYWAWSNSRAIVRNLRIFVPVAVVLGIIEPFDTGALPFWLRILYWLVLIVACAFMLPFCVRLAQRWWPPAGRGWLVFALFASALAAVPEAVLVHLVDHAMVQIVAPWFNPAAAPAALGPLDFGDALALYVSVWTIVVLLVVGASLFVLQPQVPPAADAEPPLTPGVRFLSRLPAHLGTDLVCIRMEDHYLRVRTRQGEALILLRFRDALAELGDYPGVQTHRSWWVAHQAIARLVRQPRKLEIELHGGDRVPVSHSYRAGVETLIG